jgi:hypothetical protein
MRRAHERGDRGEGADLRVLVERLCRATRG